MSVDASSFSVPSPNKRTIVTLGGDISITGNIPESYHPVALIALQDEQGNGGNIRIDASVTDIHASLFAEKALFSSGANQLYIRGTILSYNTSDNVSCPYFAPGCPYPALYNLENLRSDFLMFPGTLSTTLSGRDPATPLVIEYDSRILSNPPPGLEK
jgi:hypothetical protein